MRTGMRLIFVILSPKVGLLLAGLGVAGALDAPHSMEPKEVSALTLNEIRLKIEKVQSEIALEEKQWADEKSGEKDKEKLRQDRYSTFQKEKQELEKDIADLEKQIEGQIREFEGFKTREEEYRARFNRFHKVLLAEARQLKEYLVNSFPYRKDKRLESANILIDDIEAGNISVEEAFNRIFVNYENEDRLSSEAEVYTGDFEEEGGDLIQVKFLRVGKQVMLFANPDGSKLGIMTYMDDTTRWVREDAMDYDTRKYIRLAISTADDKALPGFASVPLPREDLPINKQAE